MQVERARQEVEEARGAPVGRVVIGAPPTIAKMLASPLVHEFQARLPRATLGIVEGLTTYVHEWLLMGRVDIALLHNPIASPALTLFPLMKEHLCLIGPATREGGGSNGSVRLRDLPRYPLIIPSRPHAFRMQVDERLASVALKPNVALEIDGVPGMLDLVREGHGYAVLPANRVPADSRRRYSIKAIVEPRLSSTLTLAISAQRPTTPLTSHTLEFLKAFVPRALNATEAQGAAAD
jgi:LysR family nitrogen assimilation transcriptional regulator